MTPRDPDFDRPSSNGTRPSRDVVKYYQRLIINPFLSVIFVASMILLGWKVPLFTKPWDILAGCLVILSAACCFVQFHCIDCGKTGLFLDWRSHACPTVQERWAGHQAIDTPFPTAPRQFFFWCLMVMVAIVGLTIAWLLKTKD